jgi:hypothetical protein
MGLKSNTKDPASFLYPFSVVKINYEASLGYIVRSRLTRLAWSQLVSK